MNFFIYLDDKIIFIPDCSFDTNTCYYDTLSNNEFKWNIGKDTLTSFTGPHRVLDGNFAYVESSRGNENDEALMLSPIFNMNGTTCITFFYHMYGINIGSLKVSLIIHEVNKEKNISNIENIIFFANQNLGKIWNEFRYNFPEIYMNKVVYKLKIVL